MLRRSVRKFREDAVSDEMVRKLLEAAHWAPSGGNRQAWRFVAVQDRRKISMIKAFSPGLRGDPPLVIVACIEKPTEPISKVVYLMDISMASQNILLAAAELGLGTCCVRSFSEYAIRKLVNLSADIDPMLLISVGYPDEKPSPPYRKPMNEICFRDSFGKAY
jgi:nitroreductase